MSGAALISTGTRVPVLLNQDGVRLGGRGGAEHLLGEQLAGAPAVLGRHDGGEVATADVADEPLGCRIDPPNDPGLVEDVARDGDVLQSLLDVAAERQASVHHGSVTDPRKCDPFAPYGVRTTRATVEVWSLWWKSRCSSSL